MRDEQIARLEHILIHRSKEYGISATKPTKEGNVVSIYSNLEDYHLFYTIRSELDVCDLNLQFQVMLDEKQFRVFIFVDPIMLSEKQKTEACLFANEVNARYKGFGHFDIDTITGDFRFDVTFPEDMLIAMPELVEKTLFESAISFYEMIHIPFIMFAKGLWQMDLAIEYFTTIMDQGWIDNGPYGL